MSSKLQFKALQKQVALNAGALLAVIASPLHSATGEYIEDPAVRAQQVTAAANADPLFSSLGARGPEVAMYWAHELKQHMDNFGQMPSDSLLSSVYTQLKNLVESDNKQESAGGMLLSALNATPMSQSAGIEVRANTAALILPILLANPMNDAVVYVPNPAKFFTEIFEVVNTAGSDFGDFKQGDYIGPFSSGQYSSMRQRFPFQVTADGVKTKLTFDSALTPAGIKLPIKRKTVRVYVAKVQTLTDFTTETNPAGVVKLGDVTYVVNAVIDYALGKVEITTNPALPAGTESHIELSVDIEKNPELVPLIEQNMKSYTVSPFERYIGADSNIQATLKSMSEFGINVRSSMVSSSKTWLANEKALGQLADMMFFVSKKSTFNAQIPANGEWKEAFEKFKAKLIAISESLLKATEESGLAGLYAGSEFLNFLHMLPADVFTVSPLYTSDKRIQYVGMLMGRFKVFHAPFEKVVKPNQALCYAKGVSVGKGAYITGDVIPPMVINQTIGRGMTQQDTVMSLGYDEIHPNDGAAWLHLLEIENYELADVNS